MIPTIEQPVQASLTPDEYFLAEFSTVPEIAAELRGIVVSEIPEDIEACLRAEEIIQAAGRLAVSGALLEKPSQANTYCNLKEAVQAAADGDELAEEMLFTNAWKEAFEQVYKIGITEVEMEVDVDNRLIQHGQLMEDVYKNNLRLTPLDSPMRPRAEAQTRNGCRIEDYYRRGLLEDNYLVVFERCAEMPDEQLDEFNFFKDTKSCSIQLATASNGKIIFETGFVAGVKELGGARHDAETTVAVAAEFGADYSRKTVDEIVDSPILVSKDAIRKGVIDIFKLWDEKAGDTFCGEDKPAEDYVEFREKCRQQELALKPTVLKVVEHMKAETSTFETDVATTERLGELTKQYMVDRAIEDHTIDPRAFGPAAPHIEEARHYQAIGDHQRAEEQKDIAQDKAETKSCPADLRGQRTGKDSDDSESSTEKSRARKGRCPYCDQEVVVDPCAKIISCWDCKALVVNGEVKYKGNGGLRARQAEEEARQAEKQKTDTHSFSLIA